MKVIVFVFTNVYALLLLQPTDRQANTFQAVIATDGQRTFVLFIYANIQWGNRATIGFNAGDGVRSIVVTTRPRDVETGSNVGVTGLYINRIDLSSILSPSNGEKLLHGMLLEISWECQNMPTICISNFFVVSNCSDVPFFLTSYIWVQPNDLFCA